MLIWSLLQQIGDALDWKVALSNSHILCAFDFTGATR